MEAKTKVLFIILFSVVICIPDIFNMLDLLEVDVFFFSSEKKPQNFLSIDLIANLQF